MAVAPAHSRTFRSDILVALVALWSTPGAVLAQDVGVHHATLASGRAADTAVQTARIDAALRRLGSPEIRTMVAETAAPLATRDGDILTIDPAIAALVRDPQEALALAAVALTWVGEWPDRLRVKDGVAAGRVGAGLVAAIAGSHLDRINPRENDRRLRERQNLRWAPAAPTYVEANGVFAARVMALLSKAGGCSGPLVTILNRIADPRGAATGLSMQRFARATLQGLGSSIYPPDESCRSRP